MKAIIPNSPESAKAQANAIVERMSENQEARKAKITESLESIAQLMPETAGFEEIAALLSLSEDSFQLLAPVFLNELQRSINNPSDQLALAQALNVAGMRVEELHEYFLNLCKEIDNTDLGLSATKKDFLKDLLVVTFNAYSEAEGLAKRQILIPIEFCHEDAKMPTYAHVTDAGMDIYALEDIDILPGETKLIPTGIKMAIPNGYAMLIHPRSGTSLKTKLRICNSIGLIDSGYRGEIGVIVENVEAPMKDIQYYFDDSGKIIIDSILHGSTIHIDKGERFAQMRLVEVPKAMFYEVDSVLAIGDNRNSGFGGTGKF